MTTGRINQVGKVVSSALLQEIDHGAALQFCRPTQVLGQHEAGRVAITHAAAAAMMP